ncbi:hypothetical protein HZC27_00240 [Candidatus Roizmanbacteria bacterium]|nr:hypothetical protein [Candidatus Roizmanbacteria bacterium]
MRLTRREFLKIASVTPPGLVAMGMLPLSPPIEPLVVNMSVSPRPTLQRDKSYSIGPPQKNEQQEDNSSWLPTGWTEFGKPGEMLSLEKIKEAGIPLLNLQKEIQLPAKNTLQVFTGSRYLNGYGTHASVYPSLGKFYNEDETQISILSAYSFSESGVPHPQSKPVKIIYAIAPPEDNTGYVAWTPWRTTGNQVEYAIVIRLNPPVSNKFTKVEDFYHWIQAIYAHEKVHVKQMERRHQKLILINPNASKSDIDKELRDNLIQDEAQAYWAQLTYGSIRNPEWLDEGTSPYGEDLRVPFKILKDKKIDPLSGGDKNDDQKKYEALWQYVIYAHTLFTYNDLIYQSRRNHPEHLYMMKLCYQERLITRDKYMDYLKQVDPQKLEQFKEEEKNQAKMSDFLLTPGVFVGVGGIAALIAAGLIAIRSRGK